MSEDAPAMPPRRILLHGATGSGKSTAAARIAERLGLPLVLADEIGWLPGWIERPLEEQRAMVSAATAADAWVLDSTYTRWRDAVTGRPDVILGLDYPRWLSLQRLLRRTVARIVTGEAVCNGNRETLRQALSRDSIIKWHFQSWKRKRLTMRAWATDPTMPPTVLFRKPAELEAWIEALEPARGAAAEASVD
ncbi:AAA family ATPase [Gryllotalpicola daejeonensis]|uniref:AAA family ATPase n=1 Tax=Gryllotalpicola daejeonensis TaxID=993087 RepID=A0ABP7ZL31_9MICO